MILRTVSYEAAVKAVVRRFGPLTEYDDYDSQCWRWFGSLTWDGYPLCRVDGENQPHYAHRVMYTADRGEPPAEGLVIDHTCHNRDLYCAGGPNCLHRRCVNPTHLDAVTPQENLRRAAERRVLRALADDTTPQIALFN